MRYWFIIGLNLLWYGCTNDADSTMIEIQAAVVPDSSCLYTTASTNALLGQFDPAIYPLESYEMVFLIRNNLVDGTTDVHKLDQTILSNNVNDVSITGFEGCWYQLTNNLTRPNTLEQGQLIDCSSIPKQSGTLLSSGSIASNGGQAVIGINVLTPQQLQQIFGSSFNAAEIPPLGYYTSNNNYGTNVKTYSLGAEDPNSPSRSAAWGENWPNYNNVPVVVQLRAVAVSQSGKVIHSGWFSFVVYICPRCIMSACGDLVEKTCSICADGSSCNTSSPCSDGSICTSGSQLSGPIPNFTATCLPNQGLTAPNCTTTIIGCGT